MLVTAVRAKAIVRSSVLCSLDELCKTFFFQRHNVKNIKKNIYKIWRAAFFSKGKACGVVGKKSRAQSYNCSKRSTGAFKHVTFLRALAKARAEGDSVSKAGGAPTPAGEVPTVHPPCARMSGFRAAAIGPKGIRTLPLNQSCFPD